MVGDPDRLQQVVWNLLSNAVKFTPRGGRIQVRLARVNSHVEIVVSDDGSGISPEFLPHVFERFRQADASTTPHGRAAWGSASPSRATSPSSTAASSRPTAPGKARARRSC